jgi:hypothetical protein
LLDQYFFLMFTTPHCFCFTFVLFGRTFLMIRRLIMFHLGFDIILKKTLILTIPCYSYKILLLAVYSLSRNLSFGTRITCRGISIPQTMTMIYHKLRIENYPYQFLHPFQRYAVYSENRVIFYLKNISDGLHHKEVWSNMKISFF